MKTLLSTLSRYRWTFLMIAFLVSFYAFMYSFHQLQQSHRGTEEAATESSQRVFHETLSKKEAVFLQNIRSRPRLVSAMTLTFAGVLLMGFGLNLYVVSRRIHGLPAMISSGAGLPSVPWGMADIVQMFVLLFFVEALLISAQLGISTVMDKEWPGKDFMLMANSLVRDILVAGFVVLVVTRKYRTKIAHMGLSTVRLWQNIKTGVLAYVAIIPALIVVLIITGTVAKLFSYEPPPQPVVQIYLNENKNPQLLFFSFFVALLGPAIEEIFFRGFTYQAFRTRFGATKAMFLSAFIFSFLHLNLVAFIPIFFLGVVLSYLYEKTGTLAAPMTVHMLHNFLMVCFTFFYKAYSAG